MLVDINTEANVTSPNSRARWIRFAVAAQLITVLAGLQMGCAKNQAMISSADVPASEGTVRATAGDNGNTKLNVQVKHLAPPEKMASDATVYVVWIQAPNASKQNVGALTLNDNLEGTLETLTPHRRFEVTVTPEPSRGVAYPTHDPVFTASVDRAED